MLTTESDNDVIEDGEKAGASGWIIKPFKPDALLDTVNRFIL